MTIKQKVCFVVMGFGKKTDYELGRTFDLDATYDAIIKPAIEEEGLRCIRADEIAHAGVIDTRMYEMLLRAELVVADISTGNVNAVYELGVRHALRPWATIIMKEEEGRLHFDLNHVATFHYRHLGEDIGAREAARAKRELGALVRTVLADEKPDSPVYTCLPTLRQPQLSEEQYEALLSEAEEAEDKLVAVLKASQKAINQDRFEEAVDLLRRAAEIKTDEPYILQQFALATYKSKQPSEIAALIDALKIIDRLSPERSNDPETLGIAGAIRKNLFLATRDRVQIDLAIRHYGRGFEVRRDYYNGENLALCHEYRSEIQRDRAEKMFDRISALKVRQSVLEIISEIERSEYFEDRTDQMWLFATKANCLLALGRDDDARKASQAFQDMQPARWQIETFEKARDAVLGFRSQRETQDV